MEFLTYALRTGTVLKKKALLGGVGVSPTNGTLDPRGTSIAKMAVLAQRLVDVVLNREGDNE